MAFSLKSKHIVGISSGLIASANGDTELWTVNINTGGAGAILKLYDGVSTSGILVAQVDASTKSTHCYGVQCRNGLFYDLSVGSADITVGYY